MGVQADLIIELDWWNELELQRIKLACTPARHFSGRSKRYAPFDLTMMECGQYDEKWAAIHMLPEEAVQAHEDVQG
ncbi:hypothetical protein L3i20_v219450 [Paenibacillus sp. L3-i20]|nr:hypothetical protein L3i20_v219450 [Paenibacillus sp. L3-i20]